MASSLCTRIYRSFLSTNPIANHHKSLLISLHHFSTEIPSGSDSDSTVAPELDPDPLSQSSDSNSRQREFGDRPLENGLDVGVYRVHTHCLIYSKTQKEVDLTCYCEFYD